MKRLALVLGIAVLLAGVWVMIPSAGDGVLPSRLPDPVADEQPPSALQGSAEDPRAPNVTEGGFERSEVDVGVAVSREGAEMHPVLVVNKESREPLPGAEVHYMTQVENEALIELQLDQEEMRRLSRDPETLLARFGKKLSADSAGRVYVPVVGFASLVGRHEDLFGQLGIARNNSRGEVPEEGYVLELERDVTLVVKVIDSDGAAAVDVPIFVMPLYEGDPPPDRYSSESTRSRAPDGLATIPHMQRWIQRYTHRQPVPSGYVVRPFIPGLTDGGAPFDPASPPEEPIVLQLPQTGRVVVRTTDGSGQVFSPQFGVTLAIAPDDPPENLSTYRPPPVEQWRAEPRADGTTVFEPVVVGRTYVAMSYLAVENAVEIFPGPLGSGEEIHVTLSTGAETYTLVGRALDHDREPMRDTKLQISYEYGRGQGTVQFQTNGEGFFRVPIQRAGEQVTLSRITIQTGRMVYPPEPDTVSFSSAEERRLIVGDNNLGDIVLETTPVIATGRVLVDGEPAQNTGHIQVEVGVRDAGRTGQRWEMKPDLTVRMGKDGQFEVVGVPRPARYRIHTQWDMMHLPIQPVEFDFGTEGLEIHLRRGGSLQATALLDEDINVGSLRLRLVAAEGQIPEPDDPQLARLGSWNDRLRGQFTQVDGGRSMFRWMSVWPGKYRFELAVRGAPKSLHSVPDVTIAAGEENRDARLEDIDLRGKLRKIRVRVVDVDGQAIRDNDWGPALVVINNRAPDATLEGYQVQGGSVSILTGEQYVDLLIVHRGFRPVELDGVTADTTVTLERLPEVVVRIAGGVPELPTGMSLRVSLREKQPQGDTRELNSDYMRGQVASWLRPPSTLQLIESGDRVRMSVARDGTHNLRVSVFNTETRRSGSVTGAEPAEIEVRSSAGEQVFEVRLPEDGLRAAIERARRGR